MTTRAQWAEPCPHCGALDDCCSTSKARLETANALERLVARLKESLDAKDKDIRYLRDTLRAELDKTKEPRS